MLDIIFALLWSFLLTLYVTPTIMRVAFFTKIVDQPTKRKKHGMTVPLLGGLSTYSGLTTATLLFSDLPTVSQCILSGSFLITMLGLKDDIMGASPIRRLLVQVIAASMVIFVADVRISSFYGILGIYELHYVVSYGVTLITILGITNAFNLIDGLDGLLGSMTCLVAFALAYFVLPFEGCSVLLVSLAGAMLSFLRYNIFSPRIFIGDTGALACGYILASYTVFFIDSGAEYTAPAICLAMLFHPIFDTIRVSYLRIRKRRSPFSADRSHIHHILRDAGLSSSRILLVILFVNILIFGSVYFFRHWSNEMLFCLLMIWAVLLHFILSYLTMRNNLRQHSVKHKLSSALST